MAWIAGIGVFILALVLVPRLTIGLVVVAAAGIGYLFYDDYRQTQLREQERALLRVDVAYDTTICSDPSFPLAITISNASARTLNKVSFAVAGYRQGYSEPLFETPYASYDSDRIIRPVSAWVGCWRVPPVARGTAPVTASSNPAQTLVWRSDRVRPTFQD